MLRRPRSTSTVLPPTAFRVSSLSMAISSRCSSSSIRGLRRSRRETLPRLGPRISSVSEGRERTGRLERRAASRMSRIWRRVALGMQIRISSASLAAAMRARCFVPPTTGIPQHVRPHFAGRHPRVPRDAKVNPDRAPAPLRGLRQRRPLPQSAPVFRWLASQPCAREELAARNAEHPAPFAEARHSPGRPWLECRAEEIPDRRPR